MKDRRFKLPDEVDERKELLIMGLFITILLAWAFLTGSLNAVLQSWMNIPIVFFRPIFNVWISNPIETYDQLAPIVAVSLWFFLIISVIRNPNRVLCSVDDDVYYITEKSYFSKKIRGFAGFKVISQPAQVTRSGEPVSISSVEGLVARSYNEYLYSHFTAFSNTLGSKVTPSICFVVHVGFRGDVEISYLTWTEGTEKEKIAIEVQEKSRVLGDILTSAYPGLQLQRLRNSTLSRVLQLYFGEEVVIGKEGYIFGSGEPLYQCYQIAQMLSKPEIKAKQDTTQIGQLIQSLVDSKQSATLMVYCKEHPIQRKNIGKNVKKMQNDNDFYHLDDEKLTRFLNENWGRDRYVELGDAITGEKVSNWKANVFLISSGRDGGHRVAGQFSTIFSGDLNQVKTKLLETKDLNNLISRIIQRRVVEGSLELSSRRLASLIHPPIEDVPNLVRIPLARFQIPPKHHGDIILGNPIFGDRVLAQTVKIKHEDLTRNVFCWGRIGTRKTSMKHAILDQVLRLHEPPNIIMWVFKADYGSLINRYPNIVVLRPGSDILPCQFNVLQEPKLDVDAFWSLLEQMFSYYDLNSPIELSPQMTKAFRAGLVNLLEYSQKERTIENLRRCIKEVIFSNPKEYVRGALTLAALDNRISRISSGVLRDVLFSDSPNITFRDIIGRNIIVDFSEIASMSTGSLPLQFITNLMFYFFNIQHSRTYTRDKLTTLAVVEEASLLIPGFHQSNMLSPAEKMSSLLRARGLGLFSITATSGISPKILESVGTFIIFQLPQKAQSEKIAKTLNLDPDQEALLRFLPDGRAIVKKMGSSTPILIKANTLKHEDFDMNQLLKNNKTSLPKLFSKRGMKGDAASFDDRHAKIWKTLLPILESPVTKNPMLNWLQASGLEVSEGELNDVLKKHLEEIAMDRVKDPLRRQQGYSMIYCLHKHSRNPKIWYMLDPLHEKLVKLGLNASWLENHAGIVVEDKIVIRYFDGSALVITKNPPPAAPFPIHIYITSRLTANRVNKWARENQEPVFAFEHNTIEGNKELINRLCSRYEWSWDSTTVHREKTEETLERNSLNQSLAN